MKKHTNEKTKQIIPISLWAIICFIFLFIGSFLTAQVYVKDSTVISINGGVLIIDKIKSEKKPVIYVSKGSIVKTLSTCQNYTIVYNRENIEKRNNSKSLVKNISKINKAIAKTEKGTRSKTKLITNLIIKETPEQYSHNSFGNIFSYAILIYSNLSKAKVGFSELITFQTLPFSSKKLVVFFKFININEISSSKSFFTRPPPLGLV